MRELEPGRGHRRISDDAGEDLDRLSCRDFLAESAWDHLTQHSVQPTHHLGAEPAQIAVAPPPHPQHHCVVVKTRVTYLTRAQRRDRDRAGIVRVVLVHVAGVEQPDSRGEFRLHVHHPLAGGEQLLRQ